ncbi:MAG: hypothetical protein CVU78_00615 [Elusimicrobia bacterium HGW-Elusimicrobia-2]|nr:MAG: hypothetical protein CVU78_00615 [Elusimicrobia bacterium HGW-Elusimicrobia-2]
MNRKLSVVLGILILIAVTHHYIQNAPAGIQPFSKIKDIKFVEIENFQSGEKATLVRKEGDWEIIISTNYPADSRRVKTLMGEIKNLKFENVISLSANKRFEHDLSSSSAIRLTTKGKKYASVLIGKQAFGRNHFYAGFENDDKSYIAGGIRRELVLTGAEYYRKRHIASVREEDASRLRITAGEKIYSLSRGESGWDFQSDSPGDFYKFISYCLNMTASGFYDAAFAPSHRIEITKKDGTTVAWEFGEAAKDKFCARVPSSNGGYIIPSEKAAAIIKFFQKHASK